ncbi:MAG: hypothetical protein ACQESP_05275 [Candidatus Muiribacteriota bacterium]
MKKLFSLLVIFSLLISTVSISADTLARTKLEQFERGSGVYDFLDSEYESSEDIPFAYTEIEKMTDIAVEYLYSGTNETTYNILADAEIKAQNLNDGYFQAKAYIEISESYAEFMNLIGVRELSRDAALAGVEVTDNKVFNSNEKVRLYNNFIKLLMKTRYYEEANEVLVDALNELDYVNDPYYKSLVSLELSIIVSVLTGDDEMAQNLMDIAVNKTLNLSDNYLRSIIAAKIADFQQIKNNEEMADNLINEALASARLVEDSYYKEKALNEVITQMILMGDKKEAFELLETEAVAEVAQIEIPYYQADSYMNIAGIYYVVNDEEKALEFITMAEGAISNISDNFYKVKALDRLFWLNYILNNDDKAYTVNENALNAVYEIEDNERMEEALLIVLNNFSKLRNFDFVNQILFK